ncbi:MAG: gamma-glutamyl-gamma-aminobutyrate hydrolase family protein [Candidatus Saccharibacteria bacterium]
MNKLIAITMCLDKTDLINPGVEYNYIRREYGEAIKQAGGQPLFVDSSINPGVVASMCDGIIISGGYDIHPTFYQQEMFATEQLEPSERTHWERQLIDACDDENVPILGICYGSQLLNVHYGGTLFQDIAGEHGSKLNHGNSSDAAIHDVTFTNRMLGFKKGQIMPSTARHHQAVRELAPGFKAVAFADDGIIEAIVGRGHYGVQWHPESDETAGLVYGAFIDECLKRARPKTLSEYIPSLGDIRA